MTMTNNRFSGLELLVENASHIIGERKSVRAFDDTTLTEAMSLRLEEALKATSNPFKGEQRFSIFEKGKTEADEKLGTYGVIKGAKYYMLSAIPKEEHSMEALGYAMEMAVLEAQRLGLGTCWLGGTFKRGQFADRMNIQEGELLPIIIPFGKPAVKDGMVGRFIRKVAGAENRLEFGKLFYEGHFGEPLKSERAGKFTPILEAVRWAPSASNKQPWRIVKDNNVFHFFLERTKGYADKLSYDIQKLDIGIAVCHFDLMAAQLRIEGEWFIEPPKSQDYGDREYIISWKMN